MLTPTSRSDANLYTYLSLAVNICQERLACSGIFDRKGMLRQIFLSQDLLASLI
ncbi:hypothetical protein ACTGWQ_10045 [Streptococcus suis]